MTSKVGLYSAIAAGSIGALAYLLINRDSRERAGSLMREGMDSLHEHAAQAKSRLSESKLGSFMKSRGNEARDIMTDAPAVCTPETRLDKAASMMEDCDCGALPVVDSKSSRKPVGVITDRDIVIRSLAEGKNPLEMTVKDCMTTDVVSVLQTATLEEVAEKMKDYQVRRVLVVDQNGRCRGIISQADLALHATKHETGETVREVSEPAGVFSGMFR